jgi:hypothetical protein
MTKERSNIMKKIISFILAFMLIPSTAYAKNEKANKHENKYEWTQSKNHKSKHNKIKATKKHFTTKKQPVIKYGRYKLPINPVEKGMGASVDYNDKKSVIIVAKGNIEIVIDFKNEVVTINGNLDTNTDIFDKKNENNMFVLIQYVAEILGMKTDCDEDEIIVEDPGLDYPTNVVITPVGTNVKANTLNSSTNAMLVTANIKAGQATGGRAELYVGSKLTAVDNEILATDKKVTFTTSDGSPTNAELQAIVPRGGEVTVRLYNAANKYVTSKVANPTLVVDYVSPKITSITSASLDLSSGQLYLNVTGAGAVNDNVDVTKIVIVDQQLGKSYRLTNNSKTGSGGVVKSDNQLLITLGSQDKRALTGFGSGNIYLTISKGALLYDNAGNTSYPYTADQTVPVNYYGTDLYAPTNVKVTTYGITGIKENTLNTLTTYMTVTADITPGQATGGRAELYVGSKLIAYDMNISSTDTTVFFTTSDGTPTNAELKTLVPTGGVVSVRLYNANNKQVTSTVGNPTLVVDYAAPTLTGIATATYLPATNQIYLNVTGAGANGDFADVTKISIFDANLQRSYVLTNGSGTGSTGVVSGSNTLLINLGILDQIGLSGFGETSMFLTIEEGSLLKDAAGNSSPSMASQVLPVTVSR